MATSKSITPITIAATAIRKDAHGRYNLNDLHKAAIAAGVATDSQRPGNFLKSDGVNAFIAALDARRSTVQNCIVGTATGIEVTHTTKGGKNPGTYAVAEVAYRYAAWMGSHSITEEFAKVSGVCVEAIKPIRHEFSFGSDIVERLFAGYTIISQFQVFGGRYRIDWYIPELRLAIEFDEKHHTSNENAKADALRQSEIEQALGCRFLRYKHDA